ncbi:MAG: hypothetical protein ABI656_03980, partial [bacterium]
MKIKNCRTSPIMADASDMHWTRSKKRSYFFRSCMVAGFCLSGVLPGYGQGLPSSPAQKSVASAQAPLLEARRIVADASVHSTAWYGPRSGPAAQPGKTIVFLANDLRNGGILGVAQGVREAAKAIGWNFRIFDA